MYFLRHMLRHDMKENFKKTNALLTIQMARVVRRASHPRLGGPARHHAQQVGEELRLHLRHARGYRPLDRWHHGETSPRLEVVLS
jgi:hypothetical protein